MSLTATYSPEDNKLRLYSSVRLDSETYERVKAAGFKWAPKQDLFVAPMWTPGRADLLIELCGEIGDEDTSLVDRAEERADRFEDYSDKRTAAAQQARAAVAAIADGIPFGQPILVGHHSEARARKDAQRIENGMRRAVQMWDTARYWEQRAAGAIRHAKYKELPAVRHRRIKGIEADKRKQERSKADAEKLIKLWSRQDLNHEMARMIANHEHLSFCFTLDKYPRQAPASQYEGSMGLWSALTDGVISAEQARDLAIPAHQRTIERANRWIAHYDNRLAYERAMLAEQIGAEAGTENALATRFDFQPGGRVLVSGEWLTVIRVNKAGGVVNSLTTSPPRTVTWRSTWNYGVEDVKDYKAPEAADVAKVAAATKLPPLCNYPGEGFIEMTSAEWKKKPADYRIVRPVAATEQHGKHRARFAFASGYRMAQVFITDEKRKDPPPASEAAEPVTFAREIVAPVARVHQPAERTEFDDMRDALKSGAAVQVVSAPQLFPTPVEVGHRMTELAELEPGQRLLEPSAGTGRLIDAAALTDWEWSGELVAVEQSQALASGLRAKYSSVQVVNADFMACEDLGQFDRILMNPPFANGQDIAHIERASSLLAPGGRLVAICANGPRQQAKLRPLASHWEELPAGTFKECGTNVNTVLIVIDGPAVEVAAPKVEPVATIAHRTPVQCAFAF